MVPEMFGDDFSEAIVTAITWKSPPLGDKDPAKSTVFPGSLGKLLW